MTTALKAGDDIARDLAWLLLSGEGFSGANMDLLSRLDAAKRALPCTLSGLLGKDSPELKKQRSSVQALMRKLGFYGGTLRKRPDAHLVGLLRRHAQVARAGATRSGRGTELILYTRFPQVQCGRGATDYRQARCAYGRTARSRGRAANVIAVAVSPEARLAAVWARFRSASRGRSVRGLSIMDHGGEDQQLIGAEILSARSAIPADLGRRFVPGATISLYGCAVGKRSTPGSRSTLADHLGKSLLPNGGTVRVLKVEAKLSTHLITPKPRHWARYTFRGCDPAADLKAVIGLMREMAGAKVRLEKRRSSTAPGPTRGLPRPSSGYPDADSYVAGGAGHPSDYPDADRHALPTA